MSDRNEWLARRRLGLGGTDVPPVVRGYEDEYGRSALDVYLDKRGLSAPDTTIEKSPDVQRGRTLEPIAAEIFERKTGIALERPTSDDDRMRFLIQSEQPWAFASVDALTKTGGTPVEIKCPRARGFRAVTEKGLPDNWQMQTLWQMYATKSQMAHVAVFSAELWDLAVVPVRRNDELLGELLDRCGAFWFSHVVAGVVPDVEQMRQAYEPLPPIGSTVADLSGDPAIEGVVKDYIVSKKLENSASEAKKAAEEFLKSVMLERGICEAKCNETKFVLSQVEGKKSVDRKLILASGLDPSQFERQGRPYQMFRAYIGNEKEGG